MPMGIEMLGSSEWTAIKREQNMSLDRMLSSRQTRSRKLQVPLQVAGIFSRTCAIHAITHFGKPTCRKPLIESVAYSESGPS